MCSAIAECLTASVFMCSALAECYPASVSVCSATNNLVAAPAAAYSVIDNIKAVYFSGLLAKDYTIIATSFPLLEQGNHPSLADYSAFFTANASLAMATLFLGRNFYTNTLIFAYHFMKPILLAVLWIPFFAGAQNFYLFFNIGLANYRGDLNSAPYALKQSNPLVAIGARYDVTEHLLLRTSVSFTKLKADDKKSPNYTVRARNLNFTTSIVEGNMALQYNILNLNDHWWTPYIFGGVGVFHFNPYTTTDSGQKVFLQPLGTEGQGYVAGKHPYNLTQFNIPIGFGAEVSLTEDLRIGLEFGYRKLFTDYIDDVSGRYADRNTILRNRGATAAALAYRSSGAYPTGSRRGDSGATDAYYFTTITLTWRPFVDWYKRDAGIASFKKEKKVGCPAQRF